MKLAGKVAIVTGSSRGIGASIAHGFGAEGARLAIVANTRPERAQAVVGEIEAAGGEAKAFTADLSRVAECERLASRVIDAFGTVDILVNNAGVYLRAPIEEATEEQWNAQIDLNLKGTYFMTKAVVPTMKAQSSGKIINVTSTFGFVGAQDCSIYCASKAGQLNITKALCLELARHGINVNSLAPGGVKTDMTTAFRAQTELKEWVDSLTPSGSHFLDPSDVVGAAVFLASSDSNSVHGANCQRRLKIRPRGGAKDCHLGWWAELGVRLGFGDAFRGFFGGSGQRSHAELKRPAPAGRPQGGMVCRVGVSLATRALEARCRPGPGDGVPQFSYRRCFCGRGSG